MLYVITVNGIDFYDFPESSTEQQRKEVLEYYKNRYPSEKVEIVKIED